MSDIDDDVEPDEPPITSIESDSDPESYQVNTACNHAVHFLA